MKLTRVEQLNKLFLEMKISPENKKMLLDMGWTRLANSTKDELVNIVGEAAAEKCWQYLSGIDKSLYPFCFLFFFSSSFFLFFFFFFLLFSFSLSFSFFSFFSLFVFFVFFFFSFCVFS